MIIDNFDITNLIYHPDRILEWMKGETIYPIYSEISLTSACNHRCKFCAPRFYLNYEPKYIDFNILLKTLDNMRKVGVKSIMFGGEGEPLLHPKFTEIVKYAKSIGFDISLTTNGVLLNRKKIEEILPNLTWIKFSVDAGDEDTYKYLHGSKDGDLKKILDNISISSFIKKLKKYNLNIGVQAILFKNNVESILLLSRSLKYLHPDYFVIKPYSEHSSSKNNKLQPPTEEQKKQFINDMEIYNDDYEFIYRDIAFENIEKKRPYNKCYGRDFMAYIDTIGNVYSCINFLGNKNFIYGNIYKTSFEDIWKNKQEISPDLDKCRIICRLDNVNRYLWKLKYPEKDVNFI